MANTDINENNIQLKQTFLNKAKGFIRKVSEFEKLYFDYTTTPSRIDKREFAKKMKEKYPNNFEGYILDGLTHYWWQTNTIEAQKSFPKSN